MEVGAPLCGCPLLPVAIDRRCSDLYIAADHGRHSEKQIDQLPRHNPSRRIGLDPQSVTGPVIWLRSGLLKVVHGEYRTYHEKLERFASKNPILWYRKFMLGQLLPHSLPVGY